MRDTQLEKKRNIKRERTNTDTKNCRAKQTGLPHLLLLLLTTPD